MQTWSKYFHGFLNLFFQSNCFICQRPTPYDFCLDCTRQVQRCCLSNPNFLWQPPLPIFAWGMYGGTLKRAIAAMKYENQPDIARPLGYWLGEAWLNSQHSSKQFVVVPIPLHASKKKERGYNQAALIAQSFCEITGNIYKANALERVRSTTAQFGLSVAEREKNLTEAFRVGTDFRRRPNAPVLLVDDIYTTGATARSAVQTLRQSRIAVYGLVAVATTVRGNR